MAEKNVYNEKDTMDINELASLNDDISPELIEQLQQKLAMEVSEMSNNTSKVSNKPGFDVNDDTTLFEEPTIDQETNIEPKDTTLSEESIGAEEENVDTSTVATTKKEIKIDPNFDDNFIKKYKAKLNKQKYGNDETKDKKEEAEDTISSAAFSESEPIEKISNGNITEKKITPAQRNYNDSLDLLDGNVKYSKYVIYIEPQNIDFIDSLTVKERKNLINKILREQDDISITKHRFRVVNAVIKHVVVAILTITVSIPIIYWTINSSLEATINNYRSSQSLFKTLYRENGKITQIKK